MSPEEELVTLGEYVSQLRDPCLNSVSTILKDFADSIWVAYSNNHPTSKGDLGTFSSYGHLSKVLAIFGIHRNPHHPIHHNHDHCNHDSSLIYQFPDSLLPDTPPPSSHHNKLPSLLNKRWEVAVTVPHLTVITNHKTLDSPANQNPPVHESDTRRP